MGPAIFSGRAAGVFFHEIFGHRVEGHRQKDETEGQTFTKSVNTKVLPDFLSVIFDPTKRKIDGIDLNGWYDYDDEGVKARPVMAVDKGVLKTFLMSRSPIKGFDHSNGHGRRQPGYEVVSRQSNLIVESTNAVPEAKLRQMLIDEVKRQNKPYGLYFRDITGGFTTTARAGLQAFKVIPVIVYRVYPDGRPDRTGARRRYRGHAAGQLRQDPGHRRQAGSVQRILRRRIGQRAGLGGFAGDPGFRNRNRKEGQVERPAAAAAGADRPWKAREAASEGPGHSQAAVAALAAGWHWSHARRHQPPDPLIRAMHDELERVRKMTLPNLEAPYFIEYLLDEAETFTVSASLGGLVSRSGANVFRQPEVHVRVGDYKFDNTNFAGGGFGGSRYDLERFPLENSYPVLRRYFWLETDSAYKSAVEAISRKRAALRNLSQNGEHGRFRARRAGPLSPSLPHAGPSTKTRGRTECARFRRYSRDYPEVKNSAVELEAERGRLRRGEFGRHRGARAGGRGLSCGPAPPRRRPME